MSARKESTSARKGAAPGFQFKITLADSRPPIWRCILVPDGTLDDLHEWIQTAMGWTDSHLHQFVIREQRYGDPEMLDDGFGEAEIIDTLDVELSGLFGRGRPPRRFIYEYDFGDGWRHEIEFEGVQEAPRGKKPPCCLGGERACPPEDIGGVWGYANYLQAIRDPDHEEHEMYVEWGGDSYDSETFNIASATRAMRRGLPAWE